MHCQFADGALPIRRRCTANSPTPHPQKTRKKQGYTRRIYLKHFSIYIYRYYSEGGRATRWSDSHEAAADPAFFPYFGVKKKEIRESVFGCLFAGCYDDF